MSNFFKNKIASIFQDGIIKNIGVLAGGTALAQLVTFLATIYLTRIYLPDDFGLLSVLNSIISLLVPLSSLRYDRAIALSENKYELKSALSLSTGLNLIFFFILCAVSFFIWLFSERFGLEDYLILIWLTPVGVLLFGFTNIFQSYFEKLSSFKLTSLVVFIESSSKASLQYFLNSFIPRIGLLVGYILSLAFSVAIYIFSYFKLSNKKRAFKVEKGDILSFAKKHKKFPKYLVWSNMIDSASQNICSITFPFLFTLEVLGNFSIAFKIVRLPAMLFSMATRRVYYPKAASYFINDRQSFFKLYKKSTKTLILVSIVPVILLEFLIPYIFNFFLDEVWASSIPYAQIILVYVFFNFINSLAHENMLIFGLQKAFLLSEVIWILLSLILIYLAYIWDKPFMAVIFYSASGVIMELTVFIIQYTKGKELKNNIQ